MRNVCHAVLGLTAFVCTYSLPAGGQTCTSDCNGDNQVAVNELVTCVNIALGNAAPSICPRSDPNNDGFVSISELITGVNYALAGCPPQPTPTHAPANQPPVVPQREIYRTYPGYEVRLLIGAVDPEGGPLHYTAEDLPEDALIDELTGLLSWTVGAEQLGPHYIPFAVTDEGLPPASTDGVLIFKVSPEDSCTLPTCDPATGCESSLVPLDESCCLEEPQSRVGEPEAGCPEGLVLFAGRNNKGFGRLQNCDYLQIIPFAQGNVNVRFHIEARCVSAAQPATLRARLETADAVFVDRTQAVDLQLRDDGYAQRLALIYSIDGPPLLTELEGLEAQLSLTLTDTDGVMVSETIRVVLTLSDLGDLPEPDIEDIPAGEAGCVGCHRPIGPSGQREGIEDAHPLHPLTCTECHGGNANTTSRVEAHVAPGGHPAFLKNLTSDELDQVPEDYLRFVNPGDLRIAAQTCGQTSCHQQHVQTVRLSTMATYGGHYTLPRYLAGAQTRAPIFAAVDVIDPTYDPETAPVGAVDALSGLREPHPLADRSAMSTLIDIYLPKACPTCHQNAFGTNNAAGNYRSSGCTACHMVYDDEGLSRSADPMISKNFPPHPVKHELTTAIPTEQCAHCHFQGGRIGLAYRGIREGGFAPINTPNRGVTLGVPLYGHDADYYFVDEDRGNAVDETPPDLHHSAGLVCIDCHVGGDVHGDGNLYSSERYQVGIRCEDCHGTVRAEISEDPGDGLFKNSKGFPLRRIRRTPDDRIQLKLATADRELEIPQIHRLLERGFNPRMQEAMGVQGNGFSHTDVLECYSCHTAWRQTCFGCHITIDDRGSGVNYTTGETSQGAVSVTRDNYSLDFYALGMNEHGKMTPLCSSMSILLSYIDESGVTHFQDRIRTSGDGKKGFGWNPFHHHTVSRTPQNCDRCHPVAAGVGPDNTATLRETYGFGNGTMLVEDGDGVTHDLSAFLNDDGELISDFPHPNTGPVPQEIRERALAIPVVPHPR